jgi:ATP-dependent DNA helicase RecG
MEIQESQTVEFKESWRDEYLKTVCAFANTDGGVLYIGVNDNGKVVGVE